MKTKACSKCGEVLPLSEFYICRSAKDGLQAKCKKCIRKYYMENRDRRRAYNRIYYKEHEEEMKANAKNRYINNKEEILVYNAQWQKDNPDKTRAATKRWMDKHPEKAIEYNTRRRARLRNTELNDFTADGWVDLLVLYKHRCVYCGAKENLEADHIVPLSKGGPHTKSNIAPACRHCNRVKNARTPAEAGFDNFVNLCEV